MQFDFDSTYDKSDQNYDSTIDSTASIKVDVVTVCYRRHVQPRRHFFLSPCRLQK